MGWHKLYLFIYLLIYLFTYLFIYLLTYLFTYLFIYLRSSKSSVHTQTCNLVIIRAGGSVRATRDCTGPNWCEILASVRPSTERFLDFNEYGTQLYEWYTMVWPTTRSKVQVMGTEVPNCENYWFQSLSPPPVCTVCIQKTNGSPTSRQCLYLTWQIFTRATLC